MSGSAGPAMKPLLPTPCPTPTHSAQERAAKPPRSLSARRIAFTTPATYGARLARLLRLRGATPLPLPTVSVGPTASTISSLRSFCSQRALASFSALAFTSRSGISAFSLALSQGQTPVPSPPLSTCNHPFIVAALGTDAEALYQGEPSLINLLCNGDPNPNPAWVRVLVPEIATPAGMVRSLGDGRGRKVLCPVPAVVGLTEPDVVPDFLADLESSGWVAVRVPAYETRWIGPGCADELVKLDCELDAIVFTSTAEVEGLLKGLDAAEWNWEMVRRRWPHLVVAAHGPVTAKGVESFGLTVDAVGERFSSFDGVLDALAARFEN